MSLADFLRLELRAATARVRELEEMLAGVESRTWIAENKVTKGDIQHSDGNGLPWFETISEFASWLRGKKSLKKWVEWNGHIYLTSEILAGKFPRHAPGRVEDVQ